MPFPPLFTGMILKLRKIQIDILLIYYFAYYFLRILIFFNIFLEIFSLLWMDFYFTVSTNHQLRRLDNSRGEGYHGFFRTVFLVPVAIDIHSRSVKSTRY